MPNPTSRLLKEIRELLTSVDKKLDKLLDRQVVEDQDLGANQKELMRQPAKSIIRLTTPHVPFEENLRPSIATLRSIKSELQPATNRKSFVPGAFVSLPEHLRQTMQAIATFGEATALQVSDKTGRSRAAESDYLNQLVDRGFLKKVRRGREIIFQVFSLHTLCPMCGSRVPLNVKFCSYCGAALFRPEKLL